MTERVALVTGGGRGIGRQICLALAADERKVAVADLRHEEAAETVAAVEAEGGTAIFVPMDVTDSDSVADGLLQVIDELGSIEILVNCAGWDDLKPFVETDEAFWDRVVEVNYKGVLRTTHGCLPSMIEAGFG
ncbi:MAG: SDR family NAD(P)-dependent oxidoreductase, partial [Actinomycetia bacterium]|nr:SDR family NAD(P)-dependent oxidoreductase [Actinomycetes bacterium]